MNCLHTSAALVVFLMFILMLVLALATNEKMTVVIELLTHMGLDTSELYELKVKWRWIVVLSIGNLFVWGYLQA